MTFLCLISLAGAGVLGYMWNTTTNELTTTQNNLASANQTIETKTGELAAKSKEITTLNGQLTTTKASLKDMADAKAALQKSLDATMCEETLDLDYGSYNDLQTGLSAFAKTQDGVGTITRNNLTYGFLDFKKMWYIEVNYNATSGGVSGLMFFAFPDDSATFFGNMACWLDPIGS